MEPLGPASETLDTEIKGWLRPDDPRHAAIIARACIALRNSGGGRLILGLDDQSGNSLDTNRPGDVRKAYHVDVISAVVGRFALPKIELRVEIKDHHGKEHPVITVPGGADFPVITRTGFEKELRQNTVYVRTISNGCPSSSEPRTPQDWERLIGLCFDQREADIGRFFRRHLPSIVVELTKGGIVNPASDQVRDVEQLLDNGRARFEKRWAEKKVQTPTDHTFTGFREVAAVLRGDFAIPAVRDHLDKIFVHQPHMTGWPPWVDSRGFADEEARPYVTERGWEALIARFRDPSINGAVDFWRIEPSGRYYLLRTYEDDTAGTLRNQKIPPGTVLDFLLLLSRAAEAIGTIRAFASGLGMDKANGRIDLAFRWSGLKGREICCWVEPMRSLMARVKAVDDVVTTTCQIPIDAPDTTVWQSVKEAVQPVFDAFGAGVGDKVIQDIVQRTLTRRL